MMPILVEAALRSLLLAALVWLALFLFNVKSAQAQSIAWRFVLFASLAMPLLMQARIDLPLLPAKPAEQATPLVAATVPQLLEAADASLVRGPGTALPAPRAERLSPAPQTPSLALSLSWPQIAFAAYAAVCGFFLSRLIMGFVLGWRIFRGAAPLSDPLTVGHDARSSDEVRAPMTFGSAILLPADFSQWPDDKRKAVIAHEAAHVRHGDFHAQLLASANRAVFWFSPLSWWLSEKLSDLAETISDDAALAHLGDRQSYAEILLDVSRDITGAQVGVAMARQATIKARIERVMRETTLAPRLSQRARLGVMLSLLPLIALSAMTGLKAAETPKPQRTTGQVQARIPQATPGASCDPVAQSSSAWNNPAMRYIVFGELHGTAEAPKVFSDVICAALRTGKRVAIGLEFPVTDQKLYAAYVNSDGTGADREKLLGTWRSQDGRTSTAMFALIEKLRVLRTMGFNPAIFTIQPSGLFSGPAGYESDMAKNILDAGKTYSDRLIFVLVGNVHGGKTAETLSEQKLPYAPMGAHLPDGATLNILVRSRTGGSAWNCQSAKDGTNKMDCGAHTFSIAATPRNVAEMPTLKLFDKIQYGYDAELTVGNYTASPPMLAKNLPQRTENTVRPASPAKPKAAEIPATDFASGQAPKPRILQRTLPGPQPLPPYEPLRNPQAKLMQRKPLDATRPLKPTLLAKAPKPEFIQLAQATPSAPVTYPPGLSPATATRRVNCAAEFYPAGSSDEGTTVIKMIIGTDGVPHDVGVQSSSGSQALDDAAIACVKTWRYRPAMKDGAPIEIPGKPSIVWKAPGKQTSNPPPTRAAQANPSPAAASGVDYSVTYAPTPRVIALRLASDGTITWDGEKMNLDELNARLKTVLVSGTPLRINVNPGEARPETIERVMAELRRLGDNVRVAGEPASGDLIFRAPLNSAAQPESINITVASNSGVYYNNVLTDLSQVRLKLAQSIQQAIAMGAPVPELQIRGDKGSQFQDVSRVILAAQQAGVPKIVVLPPPPAN